MKSIVTRGQVLLLALLVSALSARGDVDETYTREDLTSQMGEGWPETAQVFHWYKTDDPSSTNQAWAVQFDLTDPHFRLTTRLGLDNGATDTNRTARLEEMADALKAEGRHPLVAINGSAVTDLMGFKTSLMSDSRILREVRSSDILLTESSSHVLELGQDNKARRGWPVDSKSRKIRNLMGFPDKKLLRYAKESYVDTQPGDETLDIGYQHSLIGINENAGSGERTLTFLVTRGLVTDRDAVGMMVALGCRTVVENAGGNAAGMWAAGDAGKLPDVPHDLAAGLFVTYEEPVEETVNIFDPTAGKDVENDTYATLEEAMRAAGKGESIILTAPVEVRTPCTSSADCILTTSSAAEPGTAVTIADGVKMSVGGMTLENVAFQNPDGSRATVSVGTGKMLTVSTGVRNLCVRTADKGGFCMNSNLTYEVVVDCATATDENPLFGRYNADMTEDELAAGLLLVRHPTDPSMIVKPVERNGTKYLQWMVAAARVGEILYGTLDGALAAAEKLARAAEPGADSPTVEILYPIALEKPYAIGTNLTLTATNDDPRASAVLLKPGATLSVGSGARVLFANLAVTNAAKSAIVSVEAGGVAAVSGRVIVDRGFETQTEDVATGTPRQGVFELAGALTDQVRLASAAGDTAGTVVGVSSLPEGEAAATASRVINANDDELCAEAVSDGAGGVALRWRVADVSDDDAVVRLKQGDVTTNYRSLRTLFRALSGDAEIVLLKDCALTEPLTIAAGTQVSLSSDGEGPVVMTLPAGNPWKTNALFSVAGSLSVGNVIFDGSESSSKNASPAVFRILDGGSVELGAAAGIRDVTLAGSMSTVKGVVQVLGGGRFQMNDGSFVMDCSGGSSGGAAIYLAADAAFDFSGGRIVGCKHSKGAAYAASDAAISVSGGATVSGNRNGMDKTCNLSLRDASNLTLAGALTGTVGVTFGNADEETFGTVTAGGDSADHFICDVKSDGKTLCGTAAEGKLVWKADVVVPPALVKVNDDLTYGTLQDAVDAAAAGDTLTVLAPLAIDSMPVRIDKRLTLRAADPAFVVTRTSPDRTNVNKVQRAIEVAADGVRFENIVLGDDADPWARAFVHVLPGASLTLGDGAVVRNVRGTFLLREGTKEPIGRSAAGILSEGTLVMESGSRVENCANDFNKSAGGGVLITGAGATFDFKGGQVIGCSARYGGGVCVEKRAGAAVSGAGRIVGNANGNLYMAAESPLKITGAFTGRIDHMDGVVRPDTETNLFAYVTYDYADDLDALAAGAICFTNELTRACGVAVTNGTGGASYLWNTALAASPDYEKGGERWTPIGEVPPQPTPPDPPDPPDPPGPTPGKWEAVTYHPTPIAFKSIERVSDTEWTLVVTDRVEYCNYRLIWTKDLAKGFTETGKWEHAVGPAAEPVWTTNVITTGGAWFWRAEGADGTNMVYKTEE